MRLKKITFKDHYLFSNDSIKFKNRITVIAGGNGSGKTTIFNALKNYRKSTKEYFLETDGGLLKDKSFVFIDDEFTFEKLYTHFKSKKVNETLMKELKILSPRLMQNLRRFEDSLDKIIKLVAGGDKVLFGFAMLFALRKNKGINSPLILDNVFGRINSEQFKLLLRRLQRLKEQVIIFSIDVALRNIKIDYKLNFNVKDRKSTIKKMAKI